MSDHNEEEQSGTDTSKTARCKGCGYEYRFARDTFCFARMTCPECKKRIYTRTGTVVRNIEEFHQQPHPSNNPADWTLGDFAQVLLSSGRSRYVDLEAFMQALIRLPEWEDIDFLDSLNSKYTGNLKEILDDKSAPDRIYKLGKYFNHLCGTFKRADYFGAGHWQKYVNIKRGILEPREKKPRKKAPLIDEDFVYEGMLNENGEAVGMDISMMITGKRIAITGKLDFKRSYYEQRIAAAGGIFASGVSSTTDYLVIGENHREKISSKAKAAQVHDVTVVTLASLKRALDELLGKNP